MQKAQKYTESELILVLQQRQESAYEYLYDNYSRALLGIISQMISQPEIAEEVLQDVFLKVWQNIGQYNASKGRLYTWMLQIARNQSIDKLRSREVNNQNKTKELSDSVFENITGVTNPIRDAGLEKVMKGLPEDSQRLLELAYFQGYTQDEISKKLGIPLGTIKTRIRATLSLLRKNIGINI